MRNDYVVFEKHGSTHAYESFSDIPKLSEKCVVKYEDNKPESIYLPKNNPINESMPVIRNNSIVFNYQVRFNKLIPFNIPFEHIMKIAYITKEEFDRKVKNIESKIDKIILEEIICSEEVTIK